MIICPSQPWYVLTPKAARRTTYRKFSSGRSRGQGGEQSIGTSPSARIALASFNCLPSPICIFYLHSLLLSLVSFCTKNVPFIPVLVLKGLCLAWLASTNTCGFVFSSMASCQACLLLNSVVQTLAVHIWVLSFSFPVMG